MSCVLKELIGNKVIAVKVKKGAYGLSQEVIITTSDGYDFIINNDGVNEGEAGIYPGLNFFKRKVNHDDEHP